jgi:hypothetical protein
MFHSDLRYYSGLLWPALLPCRKQQFSSVDFPGEGYRVALFTFTALQHPEMSGVGTRYIRV